MRNQLMLFASWSESDKTDNQLKIQMGPDCWLDLEGEMCIAVVTHWAHLAFPSAVESQANAQEVAAAQIIGGGTAQIWRRLL